MLDKPKSKVLVVDDDIVICQTIKVLLMRNGLDIYMARSVNEAIDIIQKISFDLFLIDKNFPEDDGFALMDYLLKKQPDVPFIMMTGNASIDSAILALRKGAYDYLRKPFKYEELVNVVTHALAERHLKEENRMISHMLNDSERRYREMVQNSPDIIIMLDSRGYIFFVNNTFLAMFGYSLEAIKGVPFISIIDEKYVYMVNLFLGFTPSTSDDEPTSGIDVEILCSQDCGAERKAMDIEIRKSNISFNHNGDHSNSLPKEICIVGRDIGLRKAFEQQMIYSQKMEAVALLAGGVAHDFNNLLMGIQGYTSVVKSALGVDHPSYKKMVAIEKNVAKGSNLTSQLLNFARGGISDIQTVNLNCVIKDTLELFSINRKNIQIHLDLAKNLWDVRVDVCQMEQVFLNMFINAHHAMENGGDLFISTENVVLSLVDSKSMKLKPGLYVKVSIRDTGHGIDEKHKTKIFDPFFSTRKKSDGTGLGLASAYGIIKKHNGTITVSSSSGQGALFSIYLCVKVENSCFESDSHEKRGVQMASKLPIEVAGGKKINGNQESKILIKGATADVAPFNVRSTESVFENSEGYKENRGAVGQLGKRRGVTALIIDDEPVVKEAAVDMLKKMGIDTMIACNGREGVQKYMEHLGGIDLVVLDMVMPGMSGFETFKYIRKLDPDARILIASGYRNENEIAHMVAEGGCNFLKKPYNIDLFHDRVHSLLKTRDDKTGDFVEIS